MQVEIWSYCSALASSFCLTGRLQSLALSVLARTFGGGFGPEAMVAVAALASTDPAPSED